VVGNDTRWKTLVDSGANVEPSDLKLRAGRLRRHACGDLIQMPYAKRGQITRSRMPHREVDRGEEASRPARTYYIQHVGALSLHIEDLL